VVENFKEVSGELVVCTYESLVQAFRNSARWVKELSAVVVDEVHQIKKRWVVEELLAYCLKEGHSHSWTFCHHTGCGGACPLDLFTAFNKKPVETGAP
jgi:hypothetical protein